MTVIATETVPRAKSDSIQLAVRIPEPWLARLDALLPFIARPGVGATRTDAIRAALARGLDAYEDEMGTSLHASKSPKPRAKR